MNFKEIKRELKELNIDPQILGTEFNYLEEYADGYMTLDMKGEKILWDDVDKIKNKVREVLGDFEYMQVEEVNESCSTVIYFKDHDVYIKMDGWYSSYDGKNFKRTEFVECKPVQKTITIYKTI